MNNSYNGKWMTERLEKYPNTKSSQMSLCTSESNCPQQESIPFNFISAAEHTCLK